MSLQAYNSATDTLTPIAENDYKDSLEKISALPTASADLLNKCYLLTANQGSYTKGNIYQCQSDGSSGYAWILINGSGVPVDVVEDGNMNAVTSNAVSDKFDTLGTASAKDYTDTVRQGSHDLVESNAVASAINQALSSIYVPRGSLTCAELTSALLIDENVGNVYEMSDSGTTTALFLQGAGHPIATGSNVGIINAGQGRILFNLMANAFDLTDYQKKDLASAIEGETTVEGALGALSTKKASKVSSATNGNFAGLDASGNLTDSGSKASDFASSAIMDGATINSFGDVETALAGKANATDVASDIRDVYSVMGKNGAKNLITIQRAGYTGSYNGISYVFNNDGSVTLNGTATANAYIYLWDFNTWANEKFKAGSYIASASLDKASETKVWFGADKRDASSYIVQYFNIGVNSTTPVEKTFESDGEYYISYWVNVRNGNTVDNVTIYPMLRLAEDTDDTYVPYAMTNQQITNVIPSDASASNKLTTQDMFKVITTPSMTGIGNSNGNVKNYIPSGYTLVKVEAIGYNTHQVFFDDRGYVFVFSIDSTMTSNWTEVATSTSIAYKLYCVKFN